MLSIAQWRSRTSIGAGIGTAKSPCMSKATLSDQEIDHNQWNVVFAEITNQYRGVHARVEVFGPEVNYQVEAEGRPFDGISADNKDGERVVWIAFGGGHLTHGVHGVKSVRVLPVSGANGPVIGVEATDGTKTLVRLGMPGDHALPPGEAR
jgi:hypothetical protein